MNSTSKRSAVLEGTADDKIPVLLTVSEVAGQLRIHKSVMYDWLRRGEIAYCRVGRLIRIRESDIVSFIKRNRVDGRPTPVYGSR
jgi:excisionase family DNA binding protein